MNKVYLLLRNNKQSGPHSLADLIALAPKPFDLIWVEGRSGGWSYPTEIAGLKPYLTGAETAQQKPSIFKETASYAPSLENENLSKKITPAKIHVSLPRMVTQREEIIQDVVPAYSLEKKAEELRKKVQEYTASNFSHENKFQTKYTCSMEDVEEESTNRVYHQKRKKKKNFAKKRLSIAALFLVLVTGSYFLVQSFFDSSHKNQELAVQPFSTMDTTKAVSVQTGNLETEELATIEKPIQSLAKQNKSTAKIKEGREIIPFVNSPGKPSSSREVVDEKAEPVRQDETANSLPTSEERVTQEPVEVAPKEKKKTLAEKIDGFLDKIGSKKQKEPVLEDQPKTSTDGAERKSTRRDDETKTPVEEVDLASLVDITANNPDNWMMGVKGLKLTLRNRSNETIKTATVEVRYYNEQNSLLEKKLVYFTNVPPKKSLTVAAPEQRLADHADFKLLAISNKEDSYAKQ